MLLAESFYGAFCLAKLLTQRFNDARRKTTASSLRQ